MRSLADESRIRALMKALGEKAAGSGDVYFTGGATAVLMGWRPTTIDVDVFFEPESDRLLQAIPELKESLRVNVELAAPHHFIPELSGWRNRSLPIGQEGRLSFHHFDLYSQVLAKIERSHQQDEIDVREMFQRGLVEPKNVMEFFEAIEPLLYRYPAVDAKGFRRAVETAVAAHKK